jgi:hypothetical protein
MAKTKQTIARGRQTAKKTAVSSKSRSRSRSQSRSRSPVARSSASSSSPGKTLAPKVKLTRKQATQVVKNIETSKNLAEEAVVKVAAKRGRKPTKAIAMIEDLTAQAETAVLKAASKSPAPKKRGRKPAAAKSSSKSPAPKKRGRKPGAKPASTPRKRAAPKKATARKVASVGSGSASNKAKQSHIENDIGKMFKSVNSEIKMGGYDAVHVLANNLVRKMSENIVAGIRLLKHKPDPTKPRKQRISKKTGQPIIAKNPRVISPLSTVSLAVVMNSIEVTLCGSLKVEALKRVEKALRSYNKNKGTVISTSKREVIDRKTNKKKTITIKNKMSVKNMAKLNIRPSLIKREFSRFSGSGEVQTDTGKIYKSQYRFGQEAAIAFAAAVEIVFSQLLHSAAVEVSTQNVKRITPDILSAVINSDIELKNALGSCVGNGMF